MLAGSRFEWLVPVGELSARNFGLIIAYLIPGSVVLIGLTFASESARLWLVGASSVGPTVGTFLYVLLASVGAGMTAGAFRWLLLDSAHELTGIRRPTFDESRLWERLEAFDYLVENHYRYYQFYGNSAVAILMAYAAWCIGGRPGTVAFPLIEMWLVIVIGVFVAGSRDALRKYYSRASRLLGTLEESETTNDQRKPPIPTVADHAEDSPAPETD